MPVNEVSVSNPATALQVLLLTSAQRMPNRDCVFDALAMRLNLQIMRLDKPAQRSLKNTLRAIDLTRFDRVLLDLPFKHVYRQARFLNRLPGLVIYEEDACQNYLSHSRWFGRFSQVYRRLTQTRIVVTGASVADKLSAEGFNVHFAAKVYDPAVVYLEPPHHDIHARDIELGFIGRTASAAYSGRKQMLDALALVEPLQLVRTEPGDAYRHALNRIRFFVSADVGLDEYMAKNFEAMACGCVLLAWRQGVEEARIGLRENEHVLLYSSLDELRAHIDMLRKNPARAQAIADQGRTFAEQHLSSDGLVETLATVLIQSLPVLIECRPAWRRCLDKLRFF
jgi:glycosyltransferase involved in cell wall biosynthesis